jgi:hypothetical protein
MATRKLVHLRFNTSVARNRFAALLQKHDFRRLELGDHLDDLLGFTLWHESNVYVSASNTFAPVVTMRVMNDLSIIPTREAFFIYLESVLPDTAVDLFHTSD